MSKIGANSFVFPQSYGIVDHEKKRYLECKSHSLIVSISLSTTVGIRH